MTETARPVGHVASLDGLRALAVVGVLLAHAGIRSGPMGLGAIGVDLFFVLSGFLITSLLVREHAARGRVSLTRFWGRRFLRLMPAYYLYAGALTAAMFVFRWGWLRTHYGWTPRLYAASIWGYFVNYLPHGGIWEHQDLSFILWSLAVEEQFYFVWPVVCAVLLRAGGAAWFAWGLLAAGYLHRCLTPGGIPNTLSGRGLGIICGCAVALSLAPGCPPRVLRRFRATAWRAGLTAAVVAASAAVVGLDGMTGLDPWVLSRAYHLVLPGLFAALIAMLWFGPEDPIARALSWAPLAYLGRISYGMYLYHQVAHHLTWKVFLAGIGGWPAWIKFGARLAVYFVLTTALATASYYLLEARFLAMKARLSAAGRSGR